MLLYPEMNVYKFKIKPPYNSDKKTEMYNYFVEQHKFHLQNDEFYKKTEYNFLIENYQSYFDYLYNYFLNVSEEIFGKITLSSNNSNKAWMCLMDKNQYNPPHNHIRTSKINSVFYFNVPKGNGGELIFEHNNQKIKYFPEENDFLIFPNYLMHQPMSTDSEDYRMSVNMEIICEENVW